MSAKGTDQTSLARAIAELEAVDAALAAHATAQPVDGNSTAVGPIADARAQIRAAIITLTHARPAADETATSKRRVKIKAASETAASPTAAAAGKSATKAGSKRGERARPAPASEPAAKAPVNSLLARLGAAAAVATPPAEPAPPTAAETTPAANDVGITAEDAADRLARLEAEIDSLTQPSSARAETATATPRSASKAATPAPASSAPAPASQSPVPESEYEDDEDVEITIVGADNRSAASARHSPRVYREAATPAGDDAEVEIVQPGANRGATRSTPQPEGLRIDPHSPAAPAKENAPSRWRLFRGSR